MRQLQNFIQYLFDDLRSSAISACFETVYLKKGNISSQALLQHEIKYRNVVV